MVTVRLRGVVRFAVLAAVTFAACGPIVDPPPSFAPENRCVEHACGDYRQAAPKVTCIQGICGSQQELDFVLVVSIPTMSRFAAGSTVAASWRDLVRPTRPDQKRTTCIPPECLTLPQLYRVDGDFSVSADAVEDLTPKLLNFWNADAPTTIPVRATFTQRWSFGTFSSSASSVGLPLDDVDSVYDVRLPQDPRKGPAGAPSVGFVAALAAGDYDRVLEPVAPFDEFFPPVRASAISITAADYQRVVVLSSTAPTDDKSTMSVESYERSLSRGATGFSGWRAHIESALTGERISSYATIPDYTTSRYPLTLWMKPRGNEPWKDTTIVIRPPRGAGAVPELARVLLATDNPNVDYPTLPAPVRVSGVVRSAKTERSLPAQLVFRSQPYSHASGILTVEPGYAEVLRYTTSVRTDDGGSYAALLPPGTYDVDVLPDESTGHALGQAIFTRVGSTPAAQRGRDFAVRPAARVRGSCALSDGRKLADAQIVLRPSGALTSSLTSTEPSPPRPTRGRTGADGSFELLADAGVFDLFVRPREGTRFPWVVVPRLRVGEDDLTLEPVVVPAPVVYSARLRGPDDSIIRHAVVRAFAQLAPNTRAVEIGLAITDANGELELLLAGAGR